MSESITLSEKLKSEGNKFADFFSSLSEAQLQLEVYADGELWTIRNVLAHLMTSERGLVKLFEQIRQGGAGAADDFSIDRHNASQQVKTKDLTPAELLEQYKEVRANSAAWVSDLSDEDLEKKGRHPFLGETVIREMVKMLYIHNQTHLRDIKKILNH